MADLPDDVTRFLDDHITSVMSLEVLLHLAKGDGFFEPRELSAALGGSPDAVILCLDELHRHKLIVRRSPDEFAYRYGPVDAGIDRVVQAVGDTYARRKVAVVSRIFSRGPDDLRSFSDAFKLRKR